MKFKPRKGFPSRFEKISDDQKKLLKNYMAYISKGLYLYEVDREYRLITGNGNTKTIDFLKEYGREMADNHLRWLCQEANYINCLQNVSKHRQRKYEYEVYAFTYVDELVNQYYVKLLYNNRIDKINVIIHRSEF